jgi:PAS domain S-box-containing protein
LLLHSFVQQRIQRLSQNEVVLKANDLAGASNKKNSIHILYVDDDCSIREISKQILLEMGDFEIDNASCVDEALEKLSTTQYDVVISDYEMPQKNGLDFLKELRDQKNPISFILFTGKVREEIAIQALNLGAEGYHNKQGSPETVYKELSQNVKTIVAHNRAKKLLFESEKKYRTLVEQSTQGLLLGQGPKPHVVFVNSAMAKITGYSIQELSSLSLQQVLGLVHPDDRELFFERFKKRLEGKPTPAHYEFRGIKKDGSTVWLELSSSLIEYHGQPTLQAVFADISERKHVEEELKESEERSRAIIANSPIGIATSGADKQFLSANEAFCKILGYTEKELRKLTFKDITHPADFKESALKMEELENGKVSSFTLETRYIKKDGNVINGKVMVSEVSKRNGKPALFVVELEDITERKKTEDQRKVLERKVNDYSKYLKYMVDLRTTQLKDSNERLVKAERLAAIGELAGMVGHDLRNPLAGIKNAVYFLKKKGTTIKEEQSKEMLEVIEKAIEHSDKIINDLLEYARDMHLELAFSTLPTLLNAASRMIQVPDRIQILNHVNEEILIKVDADKIMRIFVNVIKNAIDAIPEKGTIEISSFKIGNCIEVAFSDTGTGIPEETLSKIFTPLFTTKAQGMGFGLAICKRIIEAHGGTIHVKTALNKGTTFTISLPTKPKVSSAENQTV